MGQKHKRRGPYAAPDNLPSPEEIEARAAEVRENWTEEEHLKKFVGGKPAQVFVPKHGSGKRRNGEPF